MPTAISISVAPFYSPVSNKFQSFSLSVFLSLSFFYSLSLSARSIKSRNNGITAEREIDHERILSSAQLVTFNICLRTYLSVYPLTHARHSEITHMFFAKVQDSLLVCVGKEQSPRANERTKMKMKMKEKERERREREEGMEGGRRKNNANISNRSRRRNFTFSNYSR